MANGCKEVSKSRRCPICGKSDYCCFFTVKNGEQVICKRAVGGREGEGVIGYDGNYYMYLRESGTGNAVFMDARFVKEFGSINDAVTASRREIEPPEYVDPVEQLPDYLLDKYYRAMMAHLRLENYHRDYLHSEGWTDEMIKKYNVVSFPEKDFTRFKYRKYIDMRNPYRKHLAKKMLSDLGNPVNGLKGLPGAYQIGDDWTFAGPSGIVFWQYNAKKQIVGIRIRMDYLDVNAEIGGLPVVSWDDCLFFTEKGDTWNLQPMKGAFHMRPDGSRSYRKDGMFKGKYRNFSSFHADEEEEKNNRIVNIYKNGVAAGNKLSFYFDSTRDDMHIAYITEGEKKGAFSNFTMRAPFIALPGVDSWKLLFKGKKGERPVDILKNNGCNVIVVAFDADKCTNATVLDRELKTVEAMRQEGFIIGVASWDISLGKGIDDLLAAGYKPHYEVY